MATPGTQNFGINALGPYGTHLAQALAGGVLGTYPGWEAKLIMIKRTLLLIVLAVIVGAALPSKAVAGPGATGRITDVTAISISVQDKEVVTFTLDSRTHYTKWITRKPWQEDTRLDARALQVGRFVAVHPRKDDVRVADWVQIATDMR